MSIERDDPFIVQGDFSEARFAVHGKAILEERNIVEWMGDKVLEHCGWICILPETKVRKLTQKKKNDEKNSSV